MRTKELKSIIPEYSKQFIYHIQIDAGKKFTLSTLQDLEYAAFIPLKSILINEMEYNEGDFIEFDRNGGNIDLKNNNPYATDIIIFGGERYLEPIVAEGPFVMNSRPEIAQAYKDYFAGKYGAIAIE